MFVFEQDKKLKINTVNNDPAKANIVIESTSDGKAKITMDGEELTPGGLSPVEGSGKVLVSVNGEWKEQDGYGWTEKGTQTVITWDGDTEGRETPYPGMFAYKVSDNGVPASSLIGATVVFNGHEIVVTQDMVVVQVVGQSSIVAVGEAVTSVVDTVEIEGMTIHKGLYFTKSEEGKYTSSLTYGTPDTVHKINPKYIPSCMVVTVSTEDYITYEADKTFDEISNAVNNGTVVMLAMPSDGVYANLSQLVDNQSLKIVVFTSIAYSTADEAAILTQFEIDGNNAITVRMPLIQAEEKNELPE